MDRIGEEFAVGGGAAEVAGVGEVTLVTVVGEEEGEGQGDSGGGLVAQLVGGPV
jgi:hypothetical protein